MSINLDLLKNPIVIGAVAGAITYAYMYWENEQKYKKKPSVKKKSVSLIAPAVVAVIVWFIASSYFDNSGFGSEAKPNTESPVTAINSLAAPIPNTISTNMIPQGMIPRGTTLSTTNVIDSVRTGPNVPSLITKPNFGGRSLDDISLDSFGSKSYHLVSRGNITIPASRNLNTLPAMFIEMNNDF